MKKILSLLITICTLLIACEKGPGQGGKASIKGSIKVRDYNVSFTVLNAEYPGADRNVFIIYGDDASHSDQIETSYDGVFEFKYLHIGKYTIFTYSKDSTLQSGSGEIEVLQEVEIVDKKEIVEIPEFIVFE